MTFILGAKALASADVSLGSTTFTTAATGDAGAPAWRALSSPMIAAFVSATSSVRPSRLAPVATMRPPTSLRPASRTVCLTFGASASRIGSRPDSSKAAVMVPSAAVENETSGARLLPAIVQSSSPRASTTSATMRSAAALAASAEAVATAGASDTTGRAMVIDSGVPSAASPWSSAVTRAAWSTARPSFAAETLNVPPWPASTEASTGTWSIVVATVLTAAASLSRS